MRRSSHTVASCLVTCMFQGENFQADAFITLLGVTIIITLRLQVGACTCSAPSSVVLAEGASGPWYQPVSCGYCPIRRSRKTCAPTLHSVVFCFIVLQTVPLIGTYSCLTLSRVCTVYFLHWYSLRTCMVSTWHILHSSHFRGSALVYLAQAYLAGTPWQSRTRDQAADLRFAYVVDIFYRV